MPDQGKRNIIEQFFANVGSILDGPSTWLKEKVIAPNQKDYPWYHKKFRRVPTIDECYTDDVVCFYEANSQYERDKKVDNEVVSILRERFEHCVLFERPDHVEKCTGILQEYEDALTNLFIKYGDLGAFQDVKKAYMKQKHRMIWERRHGPVGSGMKNNSQSED
ncbi:NADH dehydrogenase [ubiquinone] 1 beta subcomplex subunit 10 [Sitophilus oryzae]|uniref:NADH dehydrogenase [ubiquinone] 1 beta subcomplex subunit 10 n=1 Tax=Sitophilus oryzae TaxID=7048 RepID=A0A6J2Y4N4_SITOR|nr:NADH dehydrogenase [ubiquinone] 1 beta subcomplex subunit 10 [Sitophilus oryzae]